MEAPEKVIVVLGHTITPETVREVIRRASAVQWGTHLLRWRYFDVTHEGITYITTVFKPVGGSLFFQRQMAAVKIDREGWQV